MIYGYINNGSFLPQIEASDCDQIFCEDDYWSKLLSSERKRPNRIRPKFEKLCEEIRPNDVLLTSSLINISSDFLSALSKIFPLIERGVIVKSIDEKFDSSSCIHAERLCDALPTINEIMISFDKNRQRRRRRLENQKKIASGEGKSKKKYSPQDFDKFEEYYFKIQKKQITKKNVARELKICRPTLDKLISQFEQEFDIPQK